MTQGPIGVAVRADQPKMCLDRAVSSRFPVRSRAVAARTLAASCGFAAAAVGCWDFDYVAPSETADATADAGPSDAGVPCVTGGYYCGGERIAGDPRSLYRCNQDGSGTLTTTCATSCIVAPVGSDDKCSPPPACFVTGRYCGGDKVNGDPNVLYRCNDGGAPSVIQRCPNGCQINKNDDDACK